MTTGGSAQGDASSRIASEWAERTFAFRQGKTMSPAAGLFGHYAQVLPVGNERIVITADGIGTKIEVAERLGRYDTLGYDLLAMVTDDLAALGAEPCVVSNVLDVSVLDDAIIDELFRGLHDAAKLAGIAVVGGEIAELGDKVAGFGNKMHFAWSSTCVGHLPEGWLPIDGSSIAAGHAILAVREHGFRSNGFSTLRRELERHFGPDWHLAPCTPVAGGPSSGTWGEMLLTPSLICAPLVVALRQAGVPLTGVAHVTGGGIPSKLGRVLRATGLGASLTHLLPPPEPMQAFVALAKLDPEHAYRTFHMGPAMLFVLPDASVASAIAAGRRGRRAPRARRPRRPRARHPHHHGRRGALVRALHHVEPQLMRPLVHVFGREEYLTAHLGQRIEAMGHGHAGRVRRSTVFRAAEPLTDRELDQLGGRLRDQLAEAHATGDLQRASWAASALLVAPRPGTTDDRARMAERVAEHLLGRPVELQSATLYELETAYAAEPLRVLGEALFGNPLVDELHVLDTSSLDAWSVSAHVPPPATLTTTIALPGTDEELARLSKERELALSVPELHAIRAYYTDAARTETRRTRGLPADPTDAELEMLAQTWSEHCKHKEFGATIDAGDRTIDSLFKTTIVAATANVREQLAHENAHWLLSVFSDNAGVVAFDDQQSFVFKVETHNSPSALDPYGGAITGILGNNRDPLGTGRGGARLLFNTNVLCFGPLDYAEPLLPGQLHPRVVYEGVLAGIRDGGNHSGVPTVNGAILFDPRFAGKPLVYCGTGAMLPRTDALGAPLHEKMLAIGDLVVMVGGRVGRDGIHGATFSSRTMDDKTPRSVVQIGSPITQKRVADFLADACPRGLVAAATDNGAGGLASSVGELATLTNGARIDLAKVPLKTTGLAPWEILVSESQERMTLGIREQHLAELTRIADLHEVELSVLGVFDDSGVFAATHGSTPICELELEFLHHGWPRLHLEATVVAPVERVWSTPKAPGTTVQTLLALLRAPNVTSRERVVRRYDHEVQARTVVKPYMQRAPQDAAVLRIGRTEADASGLAVASGICPQFGDLDPYQASACAFDEALRSLVSVGVHLPFGDHANDFVCACDNFCVPNVRYDAVTNPDGKEKLGKLLRMADATFDVATGFRVPLVSGKDSMKNDFVSGGRKISVPPTVLYTLVGKLRDTRRAVTAELKADGDVLFLLEATAPTARDEALGGAGLGASELSRLLGAELGAVPRLDLPAARDLYLLMGVAHDAGMLASCHDLSDGGLAVALAEACIGGERGAQVQVPPRRHALAAWFGESPSRFLVSARPERASEIESTFGSRAVRLGRVGGDTLSLGDEHVLVRELADAYQGSALP